MGNRKIATEKNEEALAWVEKELKNKTEEFKKGTFELAVLYELSRKIS